MRNKVHSRHRAYGSLAHGLFIFEVERVESDHYTALFSYVQHPSPLIRTSARSLNALFSSLPGYLRELADSHVEHVGEFQSDVRHLSLRLYQYALERTTVEH